MSDANPLLLLSGPPGAGKTSVARELVKSAAAASVHIEGDIFWSFIAKGAVAPTAAQAKRQNLTVMQSMFAAARPFARNGYAVILDFTIGPWFLPALRPFLKDLPLDFVVLCPSKAVCARRVAERAEGRIADYGPYSELHDAFAAGPEHHTLKDDVGPAILAERIRAGLAQGAFRVP